MLIWSDSAWRDNTIEFFGHYGSRGLSGIYGIH
jgi:hypothetical protein